MPTTAQIGGIVRSAEDRVPIKRREQDWQVAEFPIADSARGIAALATLAGERYAWSRAGDFGGPPAASPVVSASNALSGALPSR